MDDDRIVERIWERDEAGLDAAVGKYRGYCFSIALRILGNPEDAEECVNDAFLDAWESIPPTRPQKLSAFLAAIVQRRAFDRLRKENALRRGGETEKLSFDELEEIISFTGDPASEVEQKLLQEVLQDFMNDLDPDRRDLFIARYWLAESIDSLAQSFGWGKSRVKMTLLRLRKKLQERLKEEGFL